MSKELVVKIEGLLSPYLDKYDIENDDDSYTFDIDEHTTKKIQNRGYDEDDRNEHLLLMRNSINLKSLLIGEDDAFFPGCDSEADWETTAIYLGNNTNLNAIGFGIVSGVDSFSFQALGKGLARNDSIYKIFFTNESFFDHSKSYVDAMVPFLTKGNITHLSLMPGQQSWSGPMKLDQKGILMLALMIARFDSLKVVEFEQVCGKGEGRQEGELDDELMSYVFQALSNHPNLESIRLIETQLGKHAKNALTALNVTVEEGDANKNDDPIMSMFEDMMSGSSSRYSSSQKAPQPILPTKVQPGIVCEVDGLKSASGKTLNKRRCAVIRHVTEEGQEDRYEVRMENEKGKDATFALKEANLSPMEKLVLPTHNRRGSESSSRSLCELLLYHKGSGPFTDPEFSPSRIILSGYASRCLEHIGSSNLMWLVDTQLEQLSAVTGLASISQDGERGAEQVLFALLEGDPMYVDVLIQTIHWTGLIDHDGDSNNDTYSEEFSNCPPTQLTGDQDSKPYVKLMSTGPFRLLVEMTRYKFGGALFAALTESEFYPLFIQRLLRLVGREAIGTFDGIKLGKMARAILLKLCPGVNLKKPLTDTDKANHLLEKTSRDLPSEWVLDTWHGEWLNDMFFN